ncbi:hypothetical protein [Acinetobacter gyllenbergii]|uniref:Uncharacterized protein n=1 Tax=Acinetobacter gyllenbergii CIP 110306 = MTCC 11365 TaxID=1217657 RepID=A0A829HDU0_9GAMM|nr:hypothetical protein [Acinetobacter gyllenbergii]EPF75161.1 hypothetical protein F957_03154 [Acinetobacter gyllenbergii CIP 110306 = MTCC 11365]EPH34693.1 hypothetical protein L293_3259 [Acinetobacter gyllenbergii CIP 110306 = MTCC 11365]
MNQIEMNKKRSFSLKHKLILLGFMRLMTLLYLSALAKNLNIYKETVSWLFSCSILIYLWLRPELIELKFKHYVFKSVDWLGIVSLILLLISCAMPD